MQDSHTAGADRAAYYARIAKKHMAPLWESLHNLAGASPRALRARHLEVRGRAR